AVYAADCGRRGFCADSAFAATESDSVLAGGQRHSAALRAVLHADADQPQTHHAGVRQQLVAERGVVVDRCGDGGADGGAGVEFAAYKRRATTTVISSAGGAPCVKRATSAWTAFTISRAGRSHSEATR